MEIPFSDAEFQTLAKIAKSQFGLNLAESKKPLVYSRLSKRLKARKVNGFPAYFDLLKDPAEEQEKYELISALTTNVTSFFRENHHFDSLRSTLTPEVISRVKNGGRLRIWSAGCSAGPEPYSIAMTLLDRFPDAARYDVRILATDIDPKIVAKARTGIYANDELQGIPEAFQRKWTRAVPNRQEFEIGDELKQLITFNELNLIANWPFKGPFDTIFCRNVAIYFDQATQQKLWQRFCDILTPSGILYIGHSERVTGEASGALEGIGITSYQKSAVTRPAR